jgi:hypothetical protein
MLGLAKKIVRGVGLDSRRLYQSLSVDSLKAALRAQGLTPLMEELRAIVPDLSEQYTDGPEGSEFDAYWEIKIRGLHAFQVSAALEALNHLPGDDHVVVDIGDSSGTHAAYIKGLAQPGKISRVISVNMDPVAVEKVTRRGGDALRCRAEELELPDGIKPSLFLSFETLEHLTDPLRFLHRLAQQGDAENLLFTVPLQRRSRFGGHHLRTPDASDAPFTPESLHIYEFSPADWALLARFAGFRPLFTRFYRQCPTWPHPLAATQPLWRHLDFEGFIAIFAERDLALANRYTGW